MPGSFEEIDEKVSDTSYIHGLNFPGMDTSIPKFPSAYLEDPPTNDSGVFLVNEQTRPSAQLSHMSGCQFGGIGQQIEHLGANDDERPGDLLTRLEHADRFAQRQLICQLEATLFDAADGERLKTLLWNYIAKNRNSNDRLDLVAVGSAIRKYVAMMDVKRLGILNELLEAGHRAAVPVEIELEVAKMVVRKFEANPPPIPDPEPALANRLAEIAELYLTPRLLPRDKYATVAMLATQALALMRSQRVSKTIDDINASPFKWFGDLLRRRLTRVLEGAWRDASADAIADLSRAIHRIHFRENVADAVTSIESR